MASLANPFGFVPLDVLYYFLLLVLGPCCFFLLLIFEGLRRELLEEYLWDGKEHLGIITHVRIGSKGHSIRYAYKAKEPSTKKSQIYFKDWTPVEELERRLIVVTALQGKPKSGIPKSLVLQRKRWLKGTAVQVAYVSSLVVMAVAIVVGASLLSLLSIDCSEDDDCFPGYPSTSQFVTAALIVPALGCGMAYLVDIVIRKRSIPGTVWKIQGCQAVTQQTEVETGDCQPSEEREGDNDPEVTPGPSAAPLPRVTWQQYQTMDDRSEIPEEEIVAVLGGAETEDDDHAREALATLKILSAEQMISNDRYREDPSQTAWDQRKLLPLALLFFAITGGLTVLLLGS